MSKLIESFKVDKNEYEKILDNEKYLMVVPFTHKASCKYGANTKWCTTKRDDDNDFEEHYNSGLLAYLIIKNPEQSKEMGSTKYGLYRGNSFDKDQLIVYDELNNENLNGKFYLMNEFDKADLTQDYWEVINTFDKYYDYYDNIEKRMSSSYNPKATMEAFIPNNTDEGPVNKKVQNTINSLKGIANQTILIKKSSFGNMGYRAIVYYTPKGKIIDVETVSGNPRVPFRLGDNYEDLLRWVDENNIETKNLRRRQYHESKSETLKENTEPKDESKSYSLLEICKEILLGKFDEDNIDHYLENCKDKNLTEIEVSSGKNGWLTFEWNNSDEFYEDWFGSSENWALKSHGTYYQLDYDYYTDSVYQDAESEGYHFIQLRQEEANRIISVINKVMGYEKFEPFTPDDYGQYGWIKNESQVLEIRDFMKYSMFPMFNSFEEKISEAYQNASVTSYAQGFSDMLDENIKKWKSFLEDHLGGVENVEWEEYQFRVSDLFSALIQSKYRNSTLVELINEDPKISGELGPNGWLTSLDEARYEHTSDEPFEELKDIYTGLIDDLEEEVSETYKDEIEEFQRSTKFLEKLGFSIDISKPSKRQKKERILTSRWGNSGFEFTKTDLGGPIGRQVLYYYGYDFESESFLISLWDKDEISKGNFPWSEYQNEPWKLTLGFISKNIAKRVSLERMVLLLTNHQMDLKENVIKEQEDNIMVYYALTGALKDHYGEDNVELLGRPPVIHIYGKHKITLDGINLMINGQKIIVEKIKTSNINDSQVDYPSIEYITNRISKEEKVPDNYLDGTTLRASQEFWDKLKEHEGLAGTNGEPALKAYKLGDGRITIGWGHTGALSEPKPKMGDTITRSQAQDYLQKDATESANCVRRFLGEWKEQGLNSYMLSQSMFDVLVSLAFNAGCQGLRNSKFIELVKIGEREKAAKLLPIDTTMINGKFTKGLTARRKDEKERFLK